MSDPTPLADLAARIDEVESALQAAVGSLADANIKDGNRVRNAAWHVSGQIYHARRLYQHYVALAGEVGKRVSPDHSLTV